MKLYVRFGSEADIPASNAKTLARNDKTKQGPIVLRQR